MRKSLIVSMLAGLACSVVGLGALNGSPAFSTVLDGFAIDTQDKAVTVTLYTDERTPYTTRSEGKQFVITLPQAQLSEEQLNSGLPVVIDNKNRIIGRAVPGEDGQVKIVLPNLPASEYTVSIQQKRPDRAAQVATVKPRSAVTEPSAASQFEKVATSLAKTPARQKPAPTTASPKELTIDESGLRLSPPPASSASTTTGNGTVWNPYVIQAPSVPEIASSPYSHYRPVPKTPRRKEPVRPAASPSVEPEPINTVSVAETQGNLPWPQPSPPAFAGGDSLSNLQALTLGDLTQMPFDDLSGPAKTGGEAPKQAQATDVAQAAATVLANPFVQLKDAILGLPSWLLITTAVFLGGIGLFAAIGGLVLLRILFMQARHGFYPGAMPSAMATADAAPLPQAAEKAKSGYASKPDRVVFQDTAAVNAMDYLKQTPDDVSRAVHNAVLIKFPHHRKGGRSAARGMRRSAVGLGS